MTASGINCPGDCHEEYPRGKNVTLTAGTRVGYMFSGWEGDCAGCGTDPVCAVITDGGKACLANFKLLVQYATTLPHLRLLSLNPAIMRNVIQILIMTWMV